METITKTIEMHHIPDDPLPVAGLNHIRGSILMPNVSDIDEAGRLPVAASDSAFDFTKAAEEDAYTRADGRSFHDQREFMSQESGYRTSATQKI